MLLDILEDVMLDLELEAENQSDADEITASQSLEVILSGLEIKQVQTAVMNNSYYLGVRSSIGLRHVTLTKRSTVVDRKAWVRVRFEGHYLGVKAIVDVLAFEYYSPDGRVLNVPSLELVQKLEIEDMEEV